MKGHDSSRFVSRQLYYLHPPHRFKSQRGKGQKVVRVKQDGRRRGREWEEHRRRTRGLRGRDRAGTKGRGEGTSSLNRARQLLAPPERATPAYPGTSLTRRHMGRTVVPATTPRSWRPVHLLHLKREALVTLCIRPTHEHNIPSFPELGFEGTISREIDVWQRR